jgi:hypothetical protein
MLEPRTHTSGTSTPGHEVSCSVRGATYSLLLPDGRAAVVDCESKFAEHMAGPAGNKRSCRIPIVDDIQADFSGDKAKLSWPVSLDRKKTASETDSFRIRDLLHTKNPESAWLESKDSCLMLVGGKRSLFFEFIALQPKVRFTDHPVFENRCTGSGIWKKNQEARFESLRPAKISFCRCVLCEQPSKARSSTAISCELRALLRVAQVVAWLPSP